jgi:hypothetical protein
MVHKLYIFQSYYILPHATDQSKPHDLNSKSRIGEIYFASLVREAAKSPSKGLEYWEE